MATNSFAVDPEVVDRTVYVTQVSPAASIEKLSEFFGFCGKICSLRLRKTDDGTQEALVEFDNPQAAKTALMLKDALIEGAPISVVALSQETLPAELERTDSEVEQANLEGQRYANDSEDATRTSTSVVASLLGAGYSLGNNAFQTAVQYDQQNQLSQKAQEVIQTIAETTSEYDARYGVSTSVNNLWEQSKTAAMPYVQAGSDAAAPYVQAGSEAAAPYLESAKVTANATVSAVMENPSVQSTIETVNAQVSHLQEETVKNIEERQHQQEQQQEEGGEQQEQPQVQQQAGGGQGWDGDQVVLRD